MTESQSILIMIHCEENTGYAISSLENIFYKAALQAGFQEENIFWSFNGLTDSESINKINCDYLNPEKDALAPFLRKNNIQIVIAFDLGYPAKVIRILKENGVKKIISYWGASMSSLNYGLKLQAKKLEYYLRRNKPDTFIFESEAMRATATNGRGIPHTATDVIYLGVNTEKFFPSYGNNKYAHQTLNINPERKIVFYSGHMEERKGVRTIIKAALHLANQNQIGNLHFVLCGNKDREADTYKEMLVGSQADSHVTFAGYRNDIAEVMRSAYMGVIASTGWDSFTMSSVEMMASGLPLIISNLQGLSETIENEKNGYLVRPGDHIELASKIISLIENKSIAERFSQNSRIRAEQKFALNIQIEKMAEAIKIT